MLPSVVGNTKKYKNRSKDMAKKDEMWAIKQENMQKILRLY